MGSNGHHILRVLVSGPAAHGIAAKLDQDPAIDLVRADAAGADFPRSVDVALHVVSSSAPNVAKTSASSARFRRTAHPCGLRRAERDRRGRAQGRRRGRARAAAAGRNVVVRAAEGRDRQQRNGATGKVVTVFSPKGGSGKTAIATNLAVASMQSDRSTLLIDLDLQFGDSALTLAIPPRATIADLAAASGDVDIDKLKAFVCMDPRTSLALLAAPKRPEEAQMVGQADLAAILDTARKAYSAIVIDTGPLFDGPMLAALDRTDQLLIVCNPEVTSLKNVRIGLETIDRLGFPRDRVSIVANRIGAAGGVSRDEIEDALEAEIAFELPDDAAVPSAINRAMPVVLADEKSRFARAITALATSVFEAAPSPWRLRSPSRTLLRGRR